MTKTSLVLLAALASAGLSIGAAAPSLAADPPTVAEATAADAKAAIERFNAAMNTQFTADKLRAIRVVAKTVHPTVATRLLDVAKDKDENVRVGAYEGLALQKTSAAKLGPALLKVVGDSDEKPAVVAAAIRALGPLGWKKAAKDLERLIWHEEDAIVCATFATYGVWKDDSALRQMYEFFDMYPDEKSWSGGSVSVDTGAEGNKDQSAAAAKWKAKYGSSRGWRPRPECSKALTAALKEITGFAFRRPDDLALYMDDPKKYPDSEKVAERVDEATRKAAHDAYHAAMAKALEIAKKEVPNDADADARSKAYTREIRPMRADILDKYKLRLSELDVILEEGKTKGWKK